MSVFYEWLFESQKKDICTFHIILYLITKTIIYIKKEHSKDYGNIRIGMVGERPPYYNTGTDSFVNTRNPSDYRRI